MLIGRAGQLIVEADAETMGASGCPVIIYPCGARTIIPSEWEVDGRSRVDDGSWRDPYRWDRLRSVPTCTSVAVSRERRTCRNLSWQVHRSAMLHRPGKTQAVNAYRV